MLLTIPSILGGAREPRGKPEEARPMAGCKDTRRRSRGGELGSFQPHGLEDRGLDDARCIGGARKQQTNKQANNKSNKQTSKQASKQTSKQASKQANKQTNTQQHHNDNDNDNDNDKT